MADIRVTVQLTEVEPGTWEATASGQWSLTISGSDEEELKGRFRDEWNSLAGTSWTPDEFQFDEY